jgi:hypothetical protein
MASKRILLFDGVRITAYMAAGSVDAESEFAPNPEGLAAFAAYLGQHRSSLFYLLADVAEEGFQLEDIPYVQGGDRNALITRRLGQYFYGTPFTTALSLGRASSGRRDEKILFMALTRPDALAPWLDALRQGGNILAGVYSITLVLATCAPPWLSGQEPILLITLTTGGVRQSFFDQGKLRFSRLTSLATHSPTEIARTSANETFKTYQYLVGQRLIGAGSTLRTVILASAEQQPVIQEYCRGSDQIIFEFIDLAATARRDKFTNHASELTTDTLLIHELAQKTPAQQFAPAAERRFYHLWQIRFALTAAALVVLASGLPFAAKTLFEAHTQQQQTSAIQAHTALTTQRYNALLGSLPQASISPDNLRALMGRYEELQKHNPGLEPLLIHLSQALNGTPKVELLNLDWEISPSLDKAPTGTQKVGAGNTAPDNANGATAWTVLKLQAQLPPGLNADLRAQKNLIDAFAARLQNPQTTVQILAMPFDAESGKALKSLTEAGNERSGLAPQFSLLIARPL